MTMFTDPKHTSDVNISDSQGKRTCYKGVDADTLPIMICVPDGLEEVRTEYLIL